VNQEDSEQNEVDGMKKGADSTGKVMHMRLACSASATYKCQCFGELKDTVIPSSANSSSLSSSSSS